MAGRIDRSGIRGTSHVPAAPGPGRRSSPCAHHEGRRDSVSPTAMSGSNPQGHEPSSRPSEPGVPDAPSTPSLRPTRYERGCAGPRRLQTSDFLAARRPSRLSSLNYYRPIEPSGLVVSIVPRSRRILSLSLSPLPAQSRTHLHSSRTKVTRGPFCDHERWPWRIILHLESMLGSIGGLSMESKVFSDTPRRTLLVGPRANRPCRARTRWCSARSAVFRPDPDRTGVRARYVCIAYAARCPNQPAISSGVTSCKAEANAA